MQDFKDLFKSADWKTEKHVPVIEAQERIKKGEAIKVKLSVGRQILHPNTTEHHIRWIALYFKPNDAKFPYEIAKIEFSSHGESAEGPNTSSVYTIPEATIEFKTEKPGTLLASSYCNIHGLWENAKDLLVD